MGASLPFLPFARPTIDAAMVAEVGETLASLQIASGPRVLEFERALSQYLGGREARVVTSATAALELALAAAGVSAGDEVITSPMTFFSVGNVIHRAGARAVFVDCDPVTRNILADRVESAITPRTRAIVPTHFAGLPCDMDALLAIAQRRGVRLIEDAALAIGSSWKGRRIGAFGDIATFSFHPNKNLTTIEGGAVVLSDAAEIRRVEELRFHGIARLADGTRDVERAGGKFNLPDVNARLGLAQLRRLDEFCERRRVLARAYFERLGPSAPCALPARAHPGEPEGHSWNMFCVRLPLERLRGGRRAFIDAMAARGIGIGVSYEPLHLTTLFRGLGHREGECPNAEAIGRETVTLPLYPSMREADVDRVCEALGAVLAADAA
jgi:dTDP-4-amino-4,6-dideoxygalactose transaminase